MLHGKGVGYSKNSQLFLTSKYHEKRCKGLEDRDNLTADEIILYEISGSQGGGMTDPDTYKIKQHPFPTTGKKTVDTRDDPRVGY